MHARAIVYTGCAGSKWMDGKTSHITIIISISSFINVRHYLLPPPSPQGVCVCAPLPARPAPSRKGCMLNASNTKIHDNTGRRVSVKVLVGH